MIRSSHWLDRFQYQKGAIKTVRRPDCSLLRLHFNTKKVRLKPAARVFAATAVDEDFNTKKVRLKPRTVLDWRRTGAFQYQKGAIKTNFDEYQLAKYAQISIPKRCD